MTETHANAGSASRLEGKWQGPLLVLAVVACAMAIGYWLISSPEPTWEQRFAEVVERTAQGDYVGADEAAFALRDITPREDRAGRAKLFAQLGEIRWRSMQSTGDRSQVQWTSLRDCYLDALKYDKESVPHRPDIAERVALAYHALGQVDKAVQWYDEATQLDPVRSARLSRRVIELAQEHQGLAGEALVVRLRHFMGAEGLDAEQYGWAVDEAVTVQIAMDRPDAAERMIEDERSKPGSERFAAHLRYQAARVQGKMGLITQADDLLIQLIPDLPVTSELYAKANLLRGRMVWRDNPLEAEKALQEVLARAPGTPMAAAAGVTLAEAYGQMRRYDEALDQYERAAAVLKEQPGETLVSLEDVCAGMGESRRILVGQGKPDKALGFALMQQRLVDLPESDFPVARRLEILAQLAGTHLAVAAKAEADFAKAVTNLADKPERIRLRGKRIDHLKAAGEVFLQRGAVAERTDNRMHGDSLWMAAEAFERAGSAVKAAEALRIFVAGRPSDTRVQEARYRLGRALQAEGHHDEAIEMYDANLKDGDPPGRHTFAVEGLIPMAVCYIAKGEAHYDQAEKILASITSETRDEITPKAEIYHSALYVLGELYHRQGKWPSAQKALDEAIQRSPGRLAPASAEGAVVGRRRYLRATRGLFLMADSSHQSARALAQQATQEKKPRRRKVLRQEADDQLTRAASGHTHVIDRLNALDEPLSALDRQYEQNSYFARGDCLYELGRYREALKFYEQAVFRFQQRPAALGGLMQMYNCHIALDQKPQAQACLARARHLRDQIDPDEHDDPDLWPSLDGWDLWLQTVEWLNPDVSDKDRS